MNKKNSVKKREAEGRTYKPEIMAIFGEHTITGCGHPLHTITKDMESKTEAVLVALKDLKAHLPAYLHEVEVFMDKNSLDIFYDADKTLQDALKFEQEATEVVFEIGAVKSDLLEIAKLFVSSGITNAAIDLTDESSRVYIESKEALAYAERLENNRVKDNTKPRKKEANA